MMQIKIMIQVNKVIKKFSRKFGLEDLKVIVKYLHSNQRMLKDNKKKF